MENQKIENQTMTEDTICEYCGWCPELPESHIMHASFEGCKYISDRYYIYCEDGELMFKPILH